MRWTLTALLILACLIPLAGAQPAKDGTLTPAELVTLAHTDLLRQPAESRPYLRYLASGHLSAADRKAMSSAIAFVVNSLSRSVVLGRPAAVGDALVRIDLRDYKIDAKSWERLGELGSGRNSIGESYFHRTLEVEKVVEVRTREYWPGGVNRADGKHYEAGWYNVVEKKKESRREIQAQGGWLPKEAILGLVKETESQFPILRADWFCYNATLEPRYHEFLGLDDTEKSAQKLADADEGGADDVDAQASGAVLLSEVSPNNRILRRTPTRRRYGKGYWWKSFDFASSVKAEDILADVDSALTKDAGAHEIIFTLANGLQGYLVSDGKGKRLDRAGIEFARDLRNGFRSPEVEIRNCMVCHQRGMIAIDDEVRASAHDKLAASVAIIKKTDERKAERFAAHYLAIDVDDLVKQDGANFEAVLKAVNGLGGAANGQALLRLLLAYEAPLAVEDMAREVGCAVADAKAAVEAKVNPNSHLARVVGAGRKMRRDQWEQAFAELAEAVQAIKGGSK